MSATPGHNAATQALEQVLARSARLAETTRPVRHALWESERYTDLRGRHHPLAAMSAAEALLVLALLERHAETLHRASSASTCCESRTEANASACRRSRPAGTRPR